MRVTALFAAVLASLLYAAGCDAARITFLWDDFNGSYRSTGNGFIEESFQVGPLFATHYYIGDRNHRLPPNTGTDQAQSFQYYAESNDDNFVTYFQTNSGWDESGLVNLVDALSRRGQDPINLYLPITYRVHVYGHNDAKNLSDPNSYWRQVLTVRKPAQVSAEIYWDASNNDTWQTLEVTQTGLAPGGYQWITFESWYPQFYGAKIYSTSFMNWENLELEYTPLPPALRDVIVIADPQDFGNTAAFHVERDDRTFGIRCTFDPGRAISPRRGDRVTLWGYQGEVAGETVLNVNTVKVTSSGNAIPAPYAMGIRSAGGRAAAPNSVGPKSAGLLARVWGKILAGIGANFFYIDDGSGVQFAPGTVGLKIYGPTTGLQPGRFVTVTGPIGTENVGALKVPIVRARNAADIVVLN